MLSEFEKFFVSKRAEQESGGVHIEFKRRSLPTPAMNVILETNSRGASISAWESGAVDIDVLDYDTGQCLFAKRYDFQTAQEMLSVLEDAYHRIINNSFTPS